MPPGVSVVGKIRAAIASTNCAWRLLRACKRSPRYSRKDCDFSFMICTRIVRSYNGQKWHVKNLDAHTCCVARTVEAIFREIIVPRVSDVPFDRGEFKRTRSTMKPVQ